VAERFKRGKPLLLSPPIEEIEYFYGKPSRVEVRLIDPAGRVLFDEQDLDPAVVLEHLLWPNAMLGAYRLAWNFLYEGKDARPHYTNVWVDSMPDDEVKTLMIQESNRDLYGMSKAEWQEARKELVGLPYKEDYPDRFDVW